MVKHQLCVLYLQPVNLNVIKYRHLAQTICFRHTQICGVLFKPKTRELIAVSVAALCYEIENQLQNIILRLHIRRLGLSFPHNIHNPSVLACMWVYLY